MKRSEALDIIDGILIDHGLPVLQGISKEILAALEYVGMTPPVFVARVATGKKYNPETDYAADTCYRSSWEDEDNLEMEKAFRNREHR